MGLIWVQAESQAFQSQLASNLDAWGEALLSWKAQITSAASNLDSGLQGEAANAIRTLFMDRIVPVLDSGKSACERTKDHLATYAAAEWPLLGDSSLNENDLQNAIDALNTEIYSEEPIGLDEDEQKQHDDDIKSMKQSVQDIQNKCHVSPDIRRLCLSACERVVSQGRWVAGWLMSQCFREGCVSVLSRGACDRCLCFSGVWRGTCHTSRGW